MQQAPTGWRRLTVLGAVAVLMAAACGSSTSSNGKSVTVIGTWSGAEQTAFLAMIQPWVNQTGVQVKYTGTRDINASLVRHPDGQPARPGRPARPGADGRVSEGRQARQAR